MLGEVALLLIDETSLWIKPRLVKGVQESKAQAGVVTFWSVDPSAFTLNSPNSFSTNMRRTAYSKERLDCPDPGYMSRHSLTIQAAQFLEPSMRMVAVSWLVEVPPAPLLHPERHSSLQACQSWR